MKSMFIDEHYKNTGSYQSSGTEILCKQTISVDPGVIRPKICGNCPPTENLHIRRSSGKWKLCLLFAIIYMSFIYCRCTGLNFSIKYLPYSSLKVSLSSAIAENVKLTKFPSPHVHHDI